MISGKSRDGRRGARRRSVALLGPPVLLLAACGGVTVVADGAVPVPDSAPASAEGSTKAPGRTAAPAKPVPGKETGPLATAVLAELAVKGRAPRTGYERSLFGDGWADLDGDGCSTREEVLQRDLTGTARRTSGGCEVIVSGVLADPYSGRSFTFRRGEETSSLVQIDHVVAVSDAWQKGAQQFSPVKRKAFFNDPMNLLAVEGRLNQSKGDGDAATWLPPNKAYRCSYVARQVAVKARYGLWVTAAEKNAVAGVLASCPQQRIPMS